MSQQKRHDLPWTLNSATGHVWSIKDAKGRTVAGWLQESTAREIVRAVEMLRAAEKPTYDGHEYNANPDKPGQCIECGLPIDFAPHLVTTDRARIDEHADSRSDRT